MKERFKVLQLMYAHAQYCASGDETLRAAELAIADVGSAPADDHVALIISDANLRRLARPALRPPPPARPPCVRAPRKHTATRSRRRGVFCVCARVQVWRGARRARKGAHRRQHSDREHER